MVTNVRFVELRAFRDLMIDRKQEAIEVGDALRVLMYSVVVTVLDWAMMSGSW
jgi:hypothetical protein